MDVTVTDTVDMGANESTVTVAKEATLTDEVIDDPVQPSDKEPTLADKVLLSDMEVVELLQPSNNEVVEPVKPSKKGVSKIRTTRLTWKLDNKNREFYGSSLWFLLEWLKKEGNFSNWYLKGNSKTKKTIQKDLAVAINADGKKRGYHDRCRDGVSVGQKINDIVRDMKKAEEYRETLVQEGKSNDAVTSLVTRRFKYFWDLYNVIIPFVKPLEDRCEGGIVAPFGTVGFEESPPIGTEGSVSMYRSQQKRKVKDKRKHESDDNTLALGHYFEHKEVTFTSEDDDSLNDQSLLCPRRKELAKWYKVDEDTKVHQKRIEDEHVSKKRAIERAMMVESLRKEHFIGYREMIKDNAYSHDWIAKKFPQYIYFFDMTQFPEDKQKNYQKKYNKWAEQYELDPWDESNDEN